MNTYSKSIERHGFLNEIQLFFISKDYYAKNDLEDEQKLFNTETNLAVVDELKWIIAEEYLWGVIIDGRFQVRDRLGGSLTEFVRSGN